jgi:hypothetical protein
LKKKQRWWFGDQWTRNVRHACIVCDKPLWLLWMRAKTWDEVASCATCTCVEISTTQSWNLFMASCQSVRDAATTRTMVRTTKQQRKRNRVGKVEDAG